MTEHPDSAASDIARIDKELELIRVQLATTAQLMAVVASVNQESGTRLGALEQKVVSHIAAITSALAQLKEDSRIYFKRETGIKERLAALESWRQTMTGDGR